MTARTLRVGLLQLQMGADVDGNDASAEAAIRDAAAQGAKLICLPELFRSRYFCQVEDGALFDLAESIPGPSTVRFGALAKSLGVTLVLSLFERRAAGLYHNTAVVMNASGEVAGVYRKMHIPDDPRYYEKFYFTPGDLGFPASPAGVECANAKLGVLVCWDQWFPEAARLTALAGAELLIYPTAIGWHPEELAHVNAAQNDAWQTVQRSHAIANGCYVLSINRVGFEPTQGKAGEGLKFWGGSFITAPDGRVIAKSGDNAPGVLVADLDLDAIEHQRRGWPFLRDRRIDAYDGLLKRFGV